MTIDGLKKPGLDFTTRRGKEQCYGNETTTYNGFKVWFCSPESGVDSPRRKREGEKKIKKKKLKKTKKIKKKKKNAKWKIK